jgi:hypothetical protein
MKLLIISERNKENKGLLQSLPTKIPSVGFSTETETVPKIHIVILSEAKNLLFFFSSQKIKKEILRTYVLRMTWKDNLTKILEHP